MRRYVRKSFMLSSIIFLIVTAVSFLCFEYIEEMKLNFLIFLLAFLSMGIHYVTMYVFHGSFLKEILWKYILVEIMVLSIGIPSGWFIKSNWWMSFVYVTPVFALAYVFGIVQINQEIQEINQKIEEKKEQKPYEE